MIQRVDSGWCCARLTMRSGRERELEFSVGVVNAVSRLHVVGIDVCKPTYSSTHNLFEEFALLVEEDVIFLSLAF